MFLRFWLFNKHGWARSAPWMSPARLWWQLKAFKLGVRGGSDSNPLICNTSVSFSCAFNDCARDLGEILFHPTWSVDVLWSSRGHCWREKHSAINCGSASFKVDHWEWFRNSRLTIVNLDLPYNNILYIKMLTDDRTVVTVSIIVRIYFWRDTAVHLKSNVIFIKFMYSLSCDSRHVHCKKKNVGTWKKEKNLALKPLI